MGEPLLRQVAAPVQRFDAELIALVEDMNDTMRALHGAGLAAPQIGVSLRVVIFEVTSNPRYPEVAPIPYTVLVNPELIPLGEEQEEGWEGCLSVPGLRGLVPRFRKLRYRGFDIEGAPIDRTVEGFHARVHGAIERLASRHPDQRLVVVAHGAVIGQVLAHATGSRPFAFLGADNASISHLIITPQRWILRRFNDTTHLDERLTVEAAPPV